MLVWKSSDSEQFLLHMEIKLYRDFSTEKETARNILQSNQQSRRTGLISAQMLHTQEKDLSFTSDIREHKVQGPVFRNFPIFLAILKVE